MSTEQDFDWKWQRAKSELENLEGRTVYTTADCKPNKILEISKGGLLVQRGLIDRRGAEVPREYLPNPHFIQWEELKDRYCQLMVEGKLRSEQHPSNPRIGATIRAIFAELSTARKCKEGRKTILRYVPDGNPPRLKSGNTLSEPDRQS